jgi:hypothetical protein
MTPTSVATTIGIRYELIAREHTARSLPCKTPYEARGVFRRTNGVILPPPGGARMVTKPYAEDDDAPTLQRAVSPSGPARFDSGVRAAAPSSVPLEELYDAGFEDEATTAVDKVPVGSLEETVTALPADDEPTTANLPVDLAAVLLLAATQSEPPPCPLGEPLPEATRKL